MPNTASYFEIPEECDGESSKRSVCQSEKGQPFHCQTCEVIFWGSQGHWQQQRENLQDHENPARGVHYLVDTNQEYSVHIVSSFYRYVKKDGLRDPAL